MPDSLRQAAICPHCNLVIADDAAWPFPAAACRCDHCRLIIGPGRAQRMTASDGDRRSRGSAAGMLANSARREDLAPGDPAVVDAALVAVALAVGSPVERMRMLDYQDAAARDVTLPSLGTVLATRTTWKAARAAAAAAVERVDSAGHEPAPA